MVGILDSVRSSRKYIKIIAKRLQMLWPLLALFLVGVVILYERKGIEAQQEAREALSFNTMPRTEAVSAQTDTLVVIDREDGISQALYAEIALILEDMRVSFDVADVSYFGDVRLNGYDKMVLCITDLDLFGEKLSKLSKWVKGGGRMMNMVTYDVTTNLSVISGKMGILEGGDAYVPVSGFSVADGFMVGGGKRDFIYDDTYYSNLNVLLDDQCTVYVRAVGSGLPLLWECPYGEGKFVVFNQTLTGKAGRGLLAAAFSLLDDVCVYPVINASAFYLDDFPAPVPVGNGEYIQKEYGMDISNFYSNVWWKDILEWEEKYGIIHTGLIIEDYSDIVGEPFVRTETTERFLFFGNMLLNHGGELGFHGYNHMPLCIEGFDYKGLYDGYNLWETPEDIALALTELQGFSEGLFPECTFRTYVPPSNVLSAEGRAVLTQTLPDIRAIASTYLPGDCVYEQEFGVGEDGIIETPRITSGAIMDEYMYLIAFSELNFHYVQSHFIHPDDVLDVDRGAELGWGVLSGNLEQYMDYIYGSAPNIEDVTGSGMADSVEAYAALSIDRKKTPDGLAFDIGGFGGKASFLMRVNNGSGEIAGITGASAERLADGLYLIQAGESHVEISVGQGGNG